MTRLLSHLRANVVAYLALFVALSGTSYAMTQLPPGSVGGRQLKNHSIDPVKLNQRYIGGYVRAWATINANGSVVASSGRPTVKMVPFVPPGRYIIVWNTKPKARCGAIASIDGGGIGTSGPLPGYAIPETATSPVSGVEVAVATYNSQGHAAALPFDVVLACSTPR